MGLELEQGTLCHVHEYGYSHMACKPQYNILHPAYLGSLAGPILVPLARSNTDYSATHRPLARTFWQHKTASCYSCLLLHL